MKTNYLNRKLKRTLSVFASVCILGYVNMNAQTEDVSVEITAGTPGSMTWYAVDEVVTMTGTATLIGGATFDVSFTVTPVSNQMLGYNDNGWGVTPASADNNTFRASTQGFATLGDIQFSNFTGGLSSSNITVSTFTHASVVDAANNADRFTYQVGATEYISSNKFTDNPTSVDLLTYGPVDIDGGSALTSINSFVIKSGSTRTQASDRWTIGSITVKVTVDISSLGVNDPLNIANAFKLHPNPASSTILLNTPISSVKIMDVTGKVVKMYTDEIEKMDVSTLASGIYVLKALSVEGAPLTSKFVIK